MVLEDAVSRGDIRAYGCATWTAFGYQPETKAYLSFRSLSSIAREVAGERPSLPRDSDADQSWRCRKPFGIRHRLSAERAPRCRQLDAASSLGLSVFAARR